MERAELVGEAEMMPGFLSWVTEDMALPSSVIANAGEGGRPRGLRRKVNAFNLDECCVIPVEILSRQIEIMMGKQGWNYTANCF